MNMPQLKLSYFDVNGGRAEPIRLAFHIGEVKFDDHRFGYEDFQEERKNTPLSQVPVLHVDGIQITQSNAILRYAGKSAGLYPDDNYQALLCDEILDTIEDCIDKIVPTLFLSGKEQKLARELLITKDLPKYLAFLEKKLISQGGQWFSDNKLTIAELKLIALINWLNSGGLEHIPQTLVENIAPKLNEVQKRVINLPEVISYYASL